MNAPHDPPPLIKNLHEILIVLERADDKILVLINANEVVCDLSSGNDAYPQTSRALELRRVNLYRGCDPPLNKLNSTIWLRNTKPPCSTLSRWPRRMDWNRQSFWRPTRRLANFTAKSESFLASTGWPNEKGARRTDLIRTKTTDRPRIFPTRRKRQLVLARAQPLMLWLAQRERPKRDMLINKLRCTFLGLSVHAGV